MAFTIKASERQKRNVEGERAPWGGLTYRCHPNEAEYIQFSDYHYNTHYLDIKKLDIAPNEDLTVKYEDGCFHIYAGKRLLAVKNMFGEESIDKEVDAALAKFLEHGKLEDLPDRCFETEENRRHVIQIIEKKFDKVFVSALEDEIAHINDVDMLKPLLQKLYNVTKNFTETTEKIYSEHLKSSDFFDDSIYNKYSNDISRCYEQLDKSMYTLKKLAHQMNSLVRFGYKTVFRWAKPVDIGDIKEEFEVGEE